MGRETRFGTSAARARFFGAVAVLLACPNLLPAQTPAPLAELLPLAPTGGPPVGPPCPPADPTPPPAPTCEAGATQPCPCPDLPRRFIDRSDQARGPRL